MRALRRKPGKAARNERRKAIATLLNAVSVAILVAAFLQPLLAGRLIVQAALVSIGWFLVVQLALHYVLGGVED